MKVLPKILNLDELYHKTPNKIIFNELLISKTPEEIIDIICDVGSDKSDTLARCSCDALVGNYYEGLICAKCNSKCISSLYSNITIDTWLEIPNSITKVLNPQVYIILSKWMGNNAKKVPYLDTIVNIKAELDEELKPHILGQGFNYFYSNFSSIINHFANIRAKKPSTKALLKFLDNNKHNMWCTKLPTVSSILQPVTKANGFVRYVYPNIGYLIKSIINLNGILLSEKMMNFSVNHIERHFFAVYSAFIDYVTTIAKERLPAKKHLLRKHIFGSRLHCTARSVAIPLIVNHEADDVHIPWKIGVSCWKYHIISMLINRHSHTIADAFNRVSKAINVYDHTIDKIMQTLIKECPYKGLPVLINRNPSLQIGSIQLLFVTKIKPGFTKPPTLIEEDSVDNMILTGGKVTNKVKYKFPKEVTLAVDDGTIASSPLIIAGFNLDYDGDELHVFPIFEMNMVPKLKVLHPVSKIFSSKYIGVSNDVSLSNQQLDRKSVV